MSSPLTPAHSLIQTLYHSYRHSPISTQGIYFSPTCLQICRPIPSYAATTRAQIVQYLKEAAAAKVKDAAGETSNAETNEIQGVYTIRPLQPDEALDFSTPEVTSSIHLTPDELRAKAKNEGWVGMRVDLWDHGAPVEGSMLVKVQYWWRWEDAASEEKLEGDVDGKGWRQCLHDIMYIGPKDGSEGEEGLEVMDLGSRLG
ncbi:hypothetical protein BKA70DRAFT_1207384 [Coprinopsis sp. MPI-PUGE-AT-0042]|nr:hypothetical protein BKA70DRAFT_1207384 [Coprinopsis sp. MPI-PUGE-AT-0042]